MAGACVSKSSRIVPGEHASSNVLLPRIWFFARDALLAAGLEPVSRDADAYQHAKTANTNNGSASRSVVDLSLAR
jgi:hypothetical protein